MGLGISHSEVPSSDNSAARGSEIILRSHELEILKKIQSKKLESHLWRYLIFRDDISVHVAGTTENMLKIIKIFTTVYPELKTLECDILNSDLLINLEIKIMRRTSNI